MSSSATLIRASVAGGILAALAFAAPASATVTTWDMHDSSPCSLVSGPSGSGCRGDDGSGSNKWNGDELAFKSNSGNKTLKGAAYHYTSTTDGGTGTNLGAAAFLGLYTGADYGLGVENLSAPDHAMDNNNGWDFIVFQLPAGTSYDQFQITVSPFDTQENMSFTVYTGSITKNTATGSLYKQVGSTQTPDVNKFANVTTTQLLNGGFTETDFIDHGSSKNAGNLYQATMPQTVTVNTTGAVNYIIIAAGVKELPTETDYFKVNTITATWVTRVPEPANLAVFAGGLAGLGVMTRRRRRKAA